MFGGDTPAEKWRKEFVEQNRERRMMSEHEETHPREHEWRVQAGNYPGNFEIMCICNSRCAYIPTLEDAIKFTTMLNEYPSLKAENERLLGWITTWQQDMEEIARTARANADRMQAEILEHD
jgi:hypothetical protein